MMVFNGTDWTIVVAQAAGVASVLYGAYKFLKKNFPKEVQAVESRVPEAIKTVAEDAVKLVGHLAESPLFAGKVVEGKLEAKHVIDQLNQTTAVSEATTILLGVGQAYAGLTGDQKVKAEAVLKVALSALGVHLTDVQVKDIFDTADKALQARKDDPVFKAVFGDVNVSVPQQSA